MRLSEKSLTSPQFPPGEGFYKPQAVLQIQRTCVTESTRTRARTRESSPSDWAIHHFVGNHS